MVASAEVEVVSPRCHPVTGESGPWCPLGRGTAGSYHDEEMKPALVGCALVLVLTACSKTSPTGESSAVRVMDVAGPGHVLGDAQGFALYVYIPDHRGPSVCYGACAQAWPPLVLPPGHDQAQAGPGVEKALLGTSRRADGDRQVTYDGWPLYLYVGDTPGQATGQALDMGTWYLVSPSGAIDETPVVSR